MTNCEIFKNVLENAVFYVFFDVKIHEKKSISEHVFKTFTIYQEFGWGQAFENFESMSRGFSISNGLTISFLLAPGGRQKHIFYATGGS